MTVILVLSTFLVLILIDYLLSRRGAQKLKVAEEPLEEAVSVPDYVEGFLVPEQFHFHPGHTWAFRERRQLLRVGVDEFAAALMGRVERIELPRPGTWVRQGQKILTFCRDGKSTQMVSPAEGEVVEVNPDALKDPGLLRKDPYGQGWLMMVHVPDEETISRNLVPANMVRSWMREAVERLYSRQPQLAGAVAADGGRPAEDLSAALPDASWKELTGEFFLTK